MQFGAKPLFENVSVKFGAGNRYGLIGANGCGKSTFMKILGDDLEPSGGQVMLEPNVRLGKLRQDQFAYEEFTVIDTVIMGHEELWKVKAERDRIYSLPEMTEEDGMAVAELETEFAEMDGYTAESRAGELLLGLGIGIEQHFGPMSEVSPGWKLRVLLAQALFSDPEVLLLDEPTNHLDLEMRLALTMALQEFSGAVLVVSHDRHLLKSTTDEFMLVADGKVQEFDGDLEDYARWLADYRLRNAPVSNTPVNPDKTDKKAQRQAAAALRQQLAPHKREADKLESELGKINEKLAKIETSLGDSAVYEAARKDELRDLLAEQAKLKVLESQLEERWMESLELLESMQAELEALS